MCRQGKAGMCMHRGERTSTFRSTSTPSVGRTNRSCRVSHPSPAQEKAVMAAHATAWLRTPPPRICDVYFVYSVPRSCSRQRMTTQASSIHAESMNDFRPFRVKVLTSRPPRTTSVAFRPKMVCTGMNGTSPRTAAGTGSVHKRAWRPLNGGIPCRRSEARRSQPIRYAEWS